MPDDPAPDDSVDVAWDDDPDADGGDVAAEETEHLPPSGPDVGLGRHRAPGRTARLDPGRPGAWALWTAGVLAALAVVGWTWLDRPAVDQVPAAAAATVATPAGTGPAPTGSAAAAATTGSVVVSVVGQVAAPGLVTLPAGSRVADAIAAAGGLLPGADPASVNGAALLGDGEQVAVGVPGAGSARRRRRRLRRRTARRAAGPEHRDRRRARRAARHRPRAGAADRRPPHRLRTVQQRRPVGRRERDRAGDLRRAGPAGPGLRCRLGERPPGGSGTRTCCSGPGSTCDWCRAPRPSGRAPWSRRAAEPAARGGGDRRSGCRRARCSSGPAAGPARPARCWSGAWPRSRSPAPLRPSGHTPGPTRPCSPSPAAARSFRSWWSWTTTRGS